MEKSQDLAWPEGSVDFERQSFMVVGSKPLIHVQDDIESAFVWCWSVRDYLKDSLLFDNKAKVRLFDEEINKYPCLVICSDIANGLKHITLRQSRSEKFAYLKVSEKITITKENTSMIQQLDGKYYITPMGDDSVEIKASIYSKSGDFIYDAYDCLQESLKAWADIEKKFKHT